MAKYEVKAPDGHTYDVNAPDGASEADAIAYVQKQFYSQEPKQAPQRNPALNEPPSVLDNLLAKLPSSWADANAKGGKLGGFAMGAADPSVGILQLAANAIGLGDKVNPSIKAKEQQYQDARAAQGRDGFDASRMLGNVAITAPVAGGTPAVTLAGKVGQAALTGGVLGAANPVTDGNYWEEKAKQTATGAAGGALAVPVAAGVSRIINPRSVSRVADLRAAGVNPTIGQTLGGWVGRTEEKAQSLPIMGDAISAARNKAREEFNLATINKAVAPIGETVDDVGHAGVRAAGDKLSAAYDAALSKLGGVKLDPQWNSDLNQLRGMASNLTPDMAKRFESILNDNLLSRVSPNGSVLAEPLKQAESEIGKKAASFASKGGAEGELGDALAQLKNLIRQQVSRSSPDAAKAVRAADEGWANLVRVEGAAKGAKGTDGIFTPGQLLTAVRQADTSVRDRATARGTALMQDWASQAQSVLGNKYPDSGTAGRLMLGAGGLASGAVSPLIPAGLLGGAAAYIPAIQKLLVGSVANRPAAAAKIAGLLGDSAPMLAPIGNAAAQSVVNRR